MNAKIMLTMTRDEVSEMIPYALICETRYGVSWDTKRRRDRWMEEFTDFERQSATALFNLAHAWHLGGGVPDNVTMSSGMLALWVKLGQFCASI